jgi:hypothetical protein
VAELRANRGAAARKETKQERQETKHKETEEAKEAAKEAAAALRFELALSVKERRWGFPRFVACLSPPRFVPALGPHLESSAQPRSERLLTQRTFVWRVLPEPCSQSRGRGVPGKDVQLLHCAAVQLG